MDAGGCPGRIIPALLSDRLLGPFRTLIPLVIASGVLFFAWNGIKTEAELITFAVLFGFVNGGVQGMAMTGLPSLTPDARKMGVRVGMILTVVSFAMLTGPPLAGALIDRDGGKYLAMQIWGGCSMIGGAGFIAAAHFAKERRKA